MCVCACVCACACACVLFLFFSTFKGEFTDGPRWAYDHKQVENFEFRVSV